MGRSNKEARPNQIVDGGGKVYSGMSAGAKVKPQEPKAGVQGRAQAEARQGKAKEAAPKPEKREPSDMEGKSGWDKIGQAGADMVTEYKSRKAAKKSSST